MSKQQRAVSPSTSSRDRRCLTGHEGPKEEQTKVSASLYERYVKERQECSRRLQQLESQFREACQASDEQNVRSEQLTATVEELVGSGEST